MSSTTPSASPSHEQHSSEKYTIGIICALSTELAAATEMLDEEHPCIAQDMNDSNSYQFGRIGEHNVVIGALPSGSTGLVSAAGVASNMTSSFHNIRMGLMVGIGGGVPSKEHDIRLGDIVVSQPSRGHGGVVQHDIGKIHPGDNFERTRSLNRPPTALLTLVTSLQAFEKRKKLNVTAHLTQLAERLPDYEFPSGLTDNLYRPDSLHEKGTTCSECRSETLVERPERHNRLTPVIHYGTIASGNQVIKDAIERDKISQRLGGVLCFEMEAAGLMDDFPCLVIRGISDYSDSHKNDGWHDYAAATAAAFAKELLNHLAPKSVAQTQTINQAMGDMSLRLAENTNVTEQTYRHVDRARESEILKWLSPSSTFSKTQHETRDCRVGDTGEWLLQDPRYLDWRSSGGLIWIHGVAGCGKTVLCSKIIDDLIGRCRTRTNHRVAYWYFQFSSATTQDMSCMLRSILRQLVWSPLPDSIQRLWNDHCPCHTEPSTSELVEALGDLVAIHQEVFLVLDALDEYPEHKSPGRHILLETIMRLLAIPQNNLRLVVTSRREPDIRKALGPVVRFSLDVDKALEGDVVKFVAHALNDESIKRWGAELMSLATQKLVHSKERRFRWTDLQIKRLRTCPTAEDFRNALDTIPKSLEETYHRALETIPEIHRQRVRKILIWLTLSFRELTSSEVAAVVAFPFVEDVLRICTSVLVTVIDGDTRETIKLAHFTVKEFLILREGFEEGLRWYRFTARLANRCVTAQAVESVFGYPPTGSKVLFAYASQFWLAHATQFDSLSGAIDSDEVQLRINSLLHNNNREQLLDWLKRQSSKQAGPTESISLSMHPIYYALVLGLKRSIIDLWEDYFSQSNQELGSYGNILDLAASMGEVEVVIWLVDRIEIPSTYYNLPHIVQHLRINVPQTLRALLQKGPKPSIGPEIVYALTVNSAGEEILKTFLEEDLASVVVTEELICAAANNKWNRKIVEFLVRNSTQKFPVNFRGLLVVAGTSHTALQHLVESREGSSRFRKEDYLELAQAKSAYTVEKLLSLGVTIPITTELIETLAASPLGSQILTLLLNTQTIEHPLTSSDVLTVAKGFGFETFTSLLRHRWEDNRLTEELVLALAFNYYLDPPARTTIPEREVRPGGLVHEKYRPNVKFSTIHSSTKALIALLDRKELEIDLTESMIALISGHFKQEVITHLVNRIGKFCIFAPDASYDRFSSLLKENILYLGISPLILQASDDSYRVMSILPQVVRTHGHDSHRVMATLPRIVRLYDSRSTAVTVSDEPGTEVDASSQDHQAAVSAELSSLPRPLPGFSYSTSEYDDRSTIYVHPVPSRWPLSRLYETFQKLFQEDDQWESYEEATLARQESEDLDGGDDTSSGSDTVDDGEQSDSDHFGPPDASDDFDDSDQPPDWDRLTTNSPSPPIPSDSFYQQPANWDSLGFAITRATGLDLSPPDSSDEAEGPQFNQTWAESDWSMSQWSNRFLRRQLPRHNSRFRRNIANSATTTDI